MRQLLTLFVVMLMAISLRADVVVLNDGTRLTGDLKRTADGWTITTADGASRNIAADSVRSVELGSGAARVASQGADALASLRRSVEAQGDINQIIERYQRFIDNTRDERVLADAKADLTLWQQRKQDGLIKHGGKWVKPEQVSQLVVEATKQAVEARELIRQNRNYEAEAAIQQAVANDPNNAAAHYLRGVILYRQDKFADARKAFEMVNGLLPQHPPTLNNLAVILWRQNQQAGALNFYDQAMQAAGVNDYILNNVAEAIGTTPEDQRKGTSFAKAMKRFAEQDQILQQQMAQRGLYRWGATWVDDRKLEDLKTAEKIIRQKLDDFQMEFDQTRTRITAIDEQIGANQRSMDELRLNRGYMDGRGNWIILPPPQAYYDLQTRNQELATEQQTLQTRLTTLQDQAKRTQQQIPVPRFTGVQQIVGVEGMPLVASPPILVKPATQPGNVVAPSMR